MEQIISLSLAAISLIASGVIYWKATIRKEYAAERDFAHLRRNYEQVTFELQRLSDDIESLQRQVAGVATLLQYAIYGKKVDVRPDRE